MIGVLVGGLVLAGVLWRRRLGEEGRAEPAEEPPLARWDVVPPLGGSS
jgi:hypothetical protein